MTAGKAVAAAGLVLAVLAPGFASAVELKLSDADVTAIVGEAVTQARDPAHGLPTGDYTLYQRNDPIRVGPSDGLIDAIVASTPREQLRYQAYLDAFQGHPPDAAAARKFADQVAGTVVFRVFAHAQSAAPEDKQFLDHFSPAHLTLPSGQQLAATETSAFGPSQDFFILGNGRHEIRWLGVVMYRFDIADLPAGTTAKLSFDDGAGHSYQYDVDLAKFR